jgi:carboxymethylenebutenolidase
MTQDLDSLLPTEPRNRREFIAAKIAAGFALAVQPIASQTTIYTSPAGLNAGDVVIPAGDIQMPGYRAMPREGGPFPTILVVQEIFGVHEHIRDLCRRFAKQGFFAVAPSLYHRQGDATKISNIQELIGGIVSKVSDKQVMTDLDATVKWAQASGSTDVNKLSVTGFCWGGRIVWMYAAHNPQVKAGAAWYGRLVGDPNPMSPTNPVDIAKDLKAPVMGLYGGRDQGIPQDTVERMRAALKTAGKAESMIQVYPDAEHGFNADYRPSYNKAAADDANAKLIAFFKQHGAA